MLGKLIDGNLYTPTEMERRKIIITNPSDESLKYNLGYKDLIINAEPEFDAETDCLVPVYTETENCIIQNWVIEKITQ